MDSSGIAPPGDYGVDENDPVEMSPQIQQLAGLAARQVNGDRQGSSAQLLGDERADRIIGARPVADANDGGFTHDRA